MVKNRSLDEAKRNPVPHGPDVIPAPEIQAGSLGERAGVPGTRSRIQKTIRVMSPELLLSTIY
jgi:hypothetical protein